MKSKTKIWTIIIFSIILISNFPPVNYFFEETYSYQNGDGSFRFTEVKGLDLETGKIRFERFITENPKNPNKELYRNFTIKPWRFWEWWQMIAHADRYNLAVNANRKKGGQ